MSATAASYYDRRPTTWERERHNQSAGLATSSSPLDHIVKRGGQQASTSQVYEKAFALSRSTSIRRGERAEAQQGNGDDYYDGQNNASASGSSHASNRASGDLLSRNVFRGSMASDASYNTITGQYDRESIVFGGQDRLTRRDSVDTVRTAEFDAEGRWGRAWADKAEDEESLYGGSEWGSEYDDGHSQDSAGLDALRKLAGGAADGFGGLTLNEVAHSEGPRVVHHTGSASQTSSSALHLQPNQGRERIVSLTPSILGGSVEHEESRGARSPRVGSHKSNDSVSTIGPDGAHVYVWPPTPEGSEISHGPYRAETSRGALAADAASVHEWEAVSDDEEGDSDDDSEGQKGIQDKEQRRRTLQAAPTLTQPPLPQPRRQASADSATGPAGGAVTVSDVLASHRVASNGSAERKGGHPTGRMPPPPPQSTRYEDPNAALPPSLGIGRTRAAAIAAADGRESIVSDLDVETLRLDGSSRRDSSSTLGSTASSRMSIGTVRYDDDRDDVIRNSGYEAGSQSPSTFSTPLARAQPMHRSTTAPTAQPTGMPTPPRGMTAPGTPKSVRPPLRQTQTSRTAVSANSAAPSRSNVGQDTKTGPTAAENFLTQGIAYHEQGDMSRSAYYFERSAKVDGGCVVGMCMWGMTLREGWGARKDPRKGFEWIQRAAARAGELMQAASSPTGVHGHRTTEAELKAIRSELKLSVYELGKCFCHGWGVKMDKHMALEYFELAAKLGDADAQAEAGALYAAGKGCKKDLKKAAKYYRMAAAQGYDLIGLSWVWKPKFDD